VQQTRQYLFHRSFAPGKGRRQVLGAPLTRGVQMCNACIARALARGALARPKAAAAHVPPAATG